MWIDREISQYISSMDHELVQIIIGPRQCGKSTLLWHMSPDFQEVTFDDLQLRTLAQNDPALFLSNYKLPLIIDEVQYAPRIFPEIKLHIDRLKRERLKNPGKKLTVIFRLTGSNQILMDKNVKESLVGRAGFYYLNTLSISEILSANHSVTCMEILFKGGWPELYISDIPTVKYLNDYVRNYIEKDIVLSAGISKQAEFHTVLGLLAARTAEILNYSDIAKDSGVKSVTIKEWVSLLERSQLVYLLRPYASNLNKRLIKSPKIHFLDTGIACRLQGWSEIEPLSRSPQIGHLFETLVLAEIVKFIQNHGKTWQIFYWRTRSGDEIDFLIKTETDKMIALDAKLGIHSISAVSLPPSFKKEFPESTLFYLVSIGGKRQKLSAFCEQIPITQLTSFLLEL